MPNRDVKIQLIGEDRASAAISAVRQQLSKLSGAASGAVASVPGLGSALGAVGGQLAAVAAGIATVAGAVKTAKWAVGLAGDAEMLTTQMGTLLGSTARAKDMVADLTKFAAETPFSINGLTESAKSLLAYGFSQEQVIPTMRELGDIASALNMPLNELAVLYGKARVQGRLFAVDINQLTNRGIPVVQEFAKQFGVAEAEVRLLVEQGKIGFPELEKAIHSLTAEGSMFGGGMEAASKTLQGQWEALSDSIDAVGRSFGEVVLPAIKEAIRLSASWLDTMKPILQGLPGLTNPTTPKQLIQEHIERAIKDGNFKAAQIQLDAAASKPGQPLFGSGTAVQLQTEISKRLREQRSKELDAEEAERKGRTIEGVKRLVGEQLRGAWEPAANTFANGLDRARIAIKPMDDFIRIRLPELAKHGEDFARLVENAKSPAEKVRDEVEKVQKLVEKGVIPAQIGEEWVDRLEATLTREKSKITFDTSGPHFLADTDQRNAAYTSTRLRIPQDRNSTLVNLLRDIAKQTGATAQGVDKIARRKQVAGVF